jgi:hypothetical protein
MLILGPAQHGYDFYHQPEWNYRSSPVTSMDLESSDRICSDLQHNRIRTNVYPFSPRSLLVIPMT